MSALRTKNRMLSKTGAALAALAVSASAAACSSDDVGGTPSPPPETVTVSPSADETTSESTPTGEPSSSEPTETSEPTSTAPETTGTEPDERPQDSVKVDTTIGTTVATPFLDITVHSVTREDGKLSIDLEVCAVAQREDRPAAEVTLDEWYLIARDGETEAEGAEDPHPVRDFEYVDPGNFEATLQVGECTSDTVVVEVAPDIAVTAVGYSDDEFQDGSNMITWTAEH